jgi:6-phosphogluconolactonase
MNRFEFIPFPSDIELARAAAADCANALTAAPPDRPFLVALSGGRIAKRFCAELAGEGRRRGTDFPSAHFFWADERCVPPEDAECNFAIARAALFTPLNVPPARIHRIRGELPPAQAAGEAAAELSRLACHPADGSPALDLVILGMGEDGHVASLFPGETEAVMAGAGVYRPVVASKPPPNRITLGYGVLAAAREVWVLASGVGKEEALAESLKPDGATPLGRVLAARSRTRIYSDIRR